MNESDDFADPNDDTDHVLDAISEQVAHNSARLDQLLSRLQNRLSQDYTHIPMIIATLMILGGFLHILFRGEFTFSLTAMIWGAIIFSLTLYFKHRVSENLTRFGESLIKLDQDRQSHARKLSVIENIIHEGIPAGMTMQHLLILLGEQANDTANSDNGFDSH